jgi:hypothetical protein
MLRAANHRRRSNNPMLMKTDATATERRIGQLADILEAPDVPYPQEARDAWTAARREVTTAEAARADAARRNPSEPGYGPHPDVIAAERALQAAAQRAAARSADLAAAKADREQTFLKATRNKLSTARPALIELCKLMEIGLNPLSDLRRFAALNNLPIHHTLNELELVVEGLNAFRRLLNRSEKWAGYE